MHHLTPQQLAEELELNEEELLERCQQLGVPIVHGRVDRHLFEAADADGPQQQARPLPRAYEQRAAA